MEEFYYRFLHLGSLQGQHKKWIHQMEGIAAVLFVVDSSSYDQVVDDSSEGDVTRTKLEESKKLFESTVNSPWLRSKSIILLFSNKDLFRAKLGNSPFPFFIPNHQGLTNDFSSASAHMDAQFRKVVQGCGKLTQEREVFTKFVDSEGQGLIPFITDVVNHIIIQEQFRVLGIC